MMDSEHLQEEQTIKDLQRVYLTNNAMLKHKTSTDLILFRRIAERGFKNSTLDS